MLSKAGTMDSISMGGPAELRRRARVELEQLAGDGEGVQAVAGVHGAVETVFGFRQQPAREPIVGPGKRRQKGVQRAPQGVA